METNESIQMLLAGLKSEMAKKIVGQEKLIEGILLAFIAGGHVLLEGVPGVAKTLTVKTFSELVGLKFKRVQFTPDVLPADVLGTMVFEPQTGNFSVHYGPVFTNILLADEINRAPAKVQSALLEAMAEQQVTLGGTSYHLPNPFFVLATQNPIEQEGTYPLPEAELDRFLLKLRVPYPSISEEAEIVKAHADCVARKEAEAATPLFTEDTRRELQAAANAVHCDAQLTDYIVSIIAATRPLETASVEDKPQGSYLSYILFGASPRASIALQRCAKIYALFENRSFVIPEDIKAVAYPVLRHRLVLSFEALAENLTADTIIEKLLSAVPLP